MSTGIEKKQKDFIRLRANTLLAQREEWRPWKKKGYRVAESDGKTILHEKEAIRRTVMKIFSNIDADIFLFGSQVKGDVTIGSDYDVGFYAGKPISGSTLTLLKGELEELPIPGRVDLVDFNSVDQGFTKHALKEVEIWKKKKSSSLLD
ncbi:nucleotidyltransferase domain-containing protein [Metallumcola ferriviriculae]|uniref:Nucleotidyltransferase domain-containing protein n=1 Tax=Metallumcola ferriviriculae TaxID=3039180 RepID=A0AAU0UPI7_9FIRM|nr:nucleotidyltransferase domain-containing protein [Desulfitibacteraceae bacterium MK1]